MGDGISIYLSKPGGQREGPYTLERIKGDLVAKKYQDTDYWAWHEGLPGWVPLYQLPGISETGASASPAPPAPAPAVAPAKPQASPPPSSPKAVSAVPAATAPEPKAVTTPPERLAPGLDGTTVEVSASPGASVPEPETEAASLPAQVSSGMPFAALEHIFLFTTADGPAASQSPEVARMLTAIIGVDRDIVLPNVPRDVVGRCAAGELFKPDGLLSDAVWKAMAAHQPELIQQARDRLYRICVRTFRIEADAVVALVLFYNKQKL